MDKEQLIVNEINSFEGFLRNERRLKRQRILVVHGKNSFTNSGAQITLQRELDAANVFFFSDFGQNPKIEDALKGVRLARELETQVIIAVGGGSALDIAKLILAFFSNHNRELDLATGKAQLHSKPPVELIAVPTTAGSGSEATHFAVVYVDGKKYSLASKFLLPTTAILDGSLIGSANRYQKTCSALDALAQAIEGCWSKGGNAQTRKLANKAIKILYKNIPLFVSGSKEFDVLQNMLTGANMAGQVINVTKTTSAHAWSYGFTVHCDIPHGHAVWLTLPAIFDLHCRKCNSEADNTLKAVINDLLCQLQLNEAESIKNSLQSFCKSLGVTVDFKSLNIDRDTREMLSKEVNMERMKNNPIFLSEHDVQSIFEIE